MAQLNKDIAQWLPSARAGSREAVGQILEACRSYLLKLAGKNLEPGLQSKSDAWDLVQETFLAAYQHFDQFRGSTEAELLGWLRQTLLNRLAKLRRRFCASHKRRLDAEVSLEASAACERSWLADVGPSPSAEAIRDEDGEAVQKALQRLPGDYQQVILLRINEGLSFGEIGRSMGRTPNSVAKLFARALRGARRELMS
jgi:RNA polymerase sigma-70 factor (ECF subfamily)